jgi:hypothetical protein
MRALQITDPANRVVYEQARVKDDAFQFYAQSTGQFAVCLSNSMSVVSGKTVAFNMYAGKALAEQDAAGAEHFTPLEASVQQLKQGIREVKDRSATK